MTSKEKKTKNNLLNSDQAKINKLNLNDCE